MTKQYTTINCDVERVLMKSVAVFGDWGTEVTIPLSVIEDGELLSEGPDQDLNVETWWCQKEGIS